MWKQLKEQPEHNVSGNRCGSLTLEQVAQPILRVSTALADNEEEVPIALLVKKKFKYWLRKASRDPLSRNVNEMIEKEVSQTLHRTPHARSKKRQVEGELEQVLQASRKSKRVNTRGETNTEGIKKLGESSIRSSKRKGKAATIVRSKQIGT
ncbi:hypothetical protein K7X08_035858 [Anisodus acutangulus]|uniref:Uncharacterized protein n=1 Tax=Anisodus acutangulus TaxID=402998 RepID=A0A9Q1L7S4_9SOLA|nr:hypothetical protein K7X08_035858 [Anisodus acutangulus]